MKSCAPRRRGQALVEFTFVFPFLLVAILGLFDVSRAMFVQLSLDAAVLSSARQAALEGGNGSRAGLLATARAAAPGVEIRADAFELVRLEGPGNEAWLEVRISSPVDFQSAAMLSAEPHLILRSSTRTRLEASP